MNGMKQSDWIEMLAGNNAYILNHIFLVEKMLFNPCITWKHEWISVK